MKKLVALLLVAVLLTGCSEKPQESTNSTATDGTSSSSAATEYDPFAQSDSDSETGMLGAFSSGVVWKEGKEFVLDYAPKVSFDYYVENDGSTTDFGLLLFVNGLSQPYRTNEDAENKTMHIFNVNESEKKTQTISFEAITGEQGDTLSVEIVSMFKPDYVQETNANYNVYHKINSLYPSKLLVTEMTGKSAPNICTDYSIEEITDEMRQKFVTMGENGGVGGNVLDETATIEALKNGLLIMPADRTEADPELTPFQTDDFVELCMYGGKEPCKYRISMYVNHELVKGAFDGSDYIDMTVSNDEICRKKVVLSEQGLTLNKWNHLYFVAVPVYTNDNFDERMVIKSPSVTLAG